MKNVNLVGERVRERTVLLTDKQKAKVRRNAVADTNLGKEKVK